MTVRRVKLALFATLALVLCASTAWVQSVPRRAAYFATIAVLSQTEDYSAYATLLATDAVSRDFTVLNRSTALIDPADVWSRDFTLLNRSLAPIVIDDSIGRLFTVLNTRISNVTPTDAVSREFTLLNRSLAPVQVTDACSREFSLSNEPAPFLKITDVVSREFSLSNEAPPFLNITDVVSRAFSVRRTAPDLSITSLSAPLEILPGQPIIIAYSVANGGDAPASGTWVDRVYLSDDDQLGDDTQLRAYIFDGVLGEGETYSHAETFVFSSTPGLYQVFVVTDDDGQLDERPNDDNNVAFAVVDAGGIEYGATVQANIDTGPEGTPVILSGQAFWLDTLEPAPNVEVEVRVRLQATRRVFSPTTDANGDFALVFDPVPGEAGRYTVFADHPLVPEDPATPQDVFTLYGMRTDPDVQFHRMVPGQVVNDQVTLRNLGDTPLTGVAAVVGGAPPNLGVQINAPTTLAPLASVPLTYTLTAAGDTTGQYLVQVDLSSTEGATERLVLPVEIAPLTPRFVASPPSLSAGMIRGEQTIVEFDVTNTGGITSGELTVTLPDLPWMSLATPQPIPPVAVNESTTVTLRLSPPADMTLGPYTGNLVISDGVAALGVSYTFTAISTATGSLQVYATDEFTYWAANTPPLQGASVTIRDAVTNAVVANGTTDVDGFAVFDALTEAFYDIEVTADQHGSFNGTFLVPAGSTRQVETFLTRELVNYEWSVFPTTIEDRYLITIDALFETNVPAPVVTIEPESVDLRLMTTESIQVDFTLTNHGLITADDVSLFIANHPRYEFTPLVTDIGDMPAQTTVTVPVIIRDTLFGGVANVADVAGDPCVGVRFETQYVLVCGVPRTYTVPVFFAIPTGNCPGGGGDGFIFPPCNCGGGGIRTGAPSFGEPIPCGGHCSKPDCPIAIANCFLGFTPAGCPLAMAQNCSGNSWADLRTCAVNITKSCLAGMIPGVGSAVGGLINLVDCSKNIPCACDCDPDDPNYKHPSCSQTTAQGTAPLAATSAYVAPARDPLTNVVVTHINRLVGMSDVFTAPFGDADWLRAPTVADEETFSDWMTAFSATTEDASEEGQRVSDNERAQLVALPLPSHRDVTHVNLFLDRWNRTLDYEAQGIMTLADVPAGMSTDFMPFDALQSTVAAGVNAEAANAADGFNDLLTGLRAAMEALAVSRQPNFPTGFASPGRAHARAAQSEGICAKVRIEIEQEAVVSRTAFKAVFELENVGDTDALDGVVVTLFVKDEFGTPSESLFGIPAPTLTGIPALDGSGSVAPGSSARAEWLIIPTSAAASGGPTLYKVSGQLSYDIAGELITVPLFPAQINVLPNASLDLDYFLERSIFSDDPFTPEVIEPAVPFSLGLLATNNGDGAAQNLRITSAQPRIIENERGLLIDFQIIGTQVGFDAATPSLAVDLGDIAPGNTAVAQWLMITSLQGQFTEYNASFEHVDGLGDPRLSLINSVDIFEMIHVVRVDEPADDLLPDFLTNELEHPLDPNEDPTDPDRKDLPDHLHTSDGAVSVVVPVLTSAINVDSVTLTATVSVTMPSDAAYIKLPDPFNGVHALQSVTRVSDAKVLIPDFNAWQTDRTFHEGDQRPILQNRVHLFDKGGLGEYLLAFRRSVTTPMSPTVGLPTATTIPIVDLGTLNEGVTEHAILEEISGKYVGADGQLQVTPLWRSRDDWAGRVIRSLTPSTAHRLRSQARVDGMVSPLSVPTNVTTSVPGDVNGDGLVTQADVDLVSGVLGMRYGDPGFDARADLDGDGIVTFADLGLVLSSLRLGDFNRDGFVRLEDYVEFEVCLGGPVMTPRPPACEPGDFDFNAHIDLRDVAGFQTVFGSGGSRR